MKPLAGALAICLNRIAAQAGVIALVCILEAGCTAQETAIANLKGGKLFAVTSERTSFYRYGPQQGNGPDESLPKDTLMTLVRPSWGYCKVHLLIDNKEGYVASEDIKPAPPTLLAALNAPIRNSSASISSGRSERESFDVRSSEPPPPETLPDPDLPPTSSVEPSPE